jgi:hypothetical protein
MQAVTSRLRVIQSHNRYHYTYFNTPRQIANQKCVVPDGKCPPEAAEHSEHQVVWDSQGRRMVCGPVWARKLLGIGGALQGTEIEEVGRGQAVLPVEEPREQD